MRAIHTQLPKMYGVGWSDVLDHPPNGYFNSI